MCIRDSLNYIKNPKILFNRKRYSINLHFDLFHGYNLLNRATELLDEAEKNNLLANLKKLNFNMEILKAA